MRDAIIAQCFGCIALLSFSNGIFLLFLVAMGVKPARTVAYLVLPSFMDVMLKLPFARLGN